MLSLSKLIKEFIRSRNDGGAMEPENPKPNLLTQNNQNNETETDEIPGNPELDNSDARQDSRTDQECAEQGTGSRGEIGTSFHDVEEAYKRGVIDGRNQVIEERYFPKHDDGIPHFHGRASYEMPGSDIFSMAREA